MVEGKDWEDKIIQQMVEMFRQMGLDVSADDLVRMMGQIQSQFEEMGIDPEKIASGDVKINLQSDMGDLGKLFGEGAPDISDLLGQMGVDVKMGDKSTTETEPEVEVEMAESEDEESISKVPIADVYVDGDSMNVTIDISRHATDDDESLEINLSGGGATLQLMKSSQIRPFQRFDLPHAAASVDAWDLNNGILDITLTLREKDQTN